MKYCPNCNKKVQTYFRFLKHRRVEVICKECGSIIEIITPLTEYKKEETVSRYKKGDNI